MKPTNGGSDLDRRDLDSTEVNRLVTRERIHGFLGEVKPFKRHVDRQHGDRLAAIGDVVTCATSGRIPARDGIHPTDVGEVGKGTEGGVPFGDEAVGAVRAGDGRQGKGRIVVRCVVRQRLCCLCERGESEREGSSGEHCKFHGGDEEVDKVKSSVRWVYGSRQWGLCRRWVVHLYVPYRVRSHSEYPRRQNTYLAA